MLKLRDNIDLSDPNAIDSLWREFFLSENQIVLSEALCKEASRFLVLCQRYKLVANDVSDQQVIKRLNYFDISDSAKFASWNFVTTYPTLNGKPKRLSVSKMFMSALADNQQIWSDENIKELKLESYRALEFENIASTILLYRNRYSHWHHPINDLGHVVKLVGTIMRFFEIFGDHGYLNVDTSLIKRRLLFVNKIYSEEQIDEQEESTPKLEIVENKLEMNHSVEQFGKIGLEIGTLTEDDASEDEKLIPEVSEHLLQSDEQKKQALLRLRGRILDSSKIGKKPISRDRCILSRQIIKELLFLKPKNEQDLIKSITIKFLIDTYGDDTQEQISEYSDEILDILKDKN